MSDLWMNLDELHRIVQRAEKETGEQGRSRMPRHLQNNATSARRGSSLASFGNQAPVFGRMFSKGPSQMSHRSESFRAKLSFGEATSDESAL